MDKFYEKHKNMFFTYNDVKYYYGTKFKMKIKHKYGFDQIVNAYFSGYGEGYYNGKLYIGYNTTLDESENYKFRSGLYYRNYIYISEEELRESIVKIIEGNHCIEFETRKKYCKDTDDLNLMAKWGMYIFAMGWSSIFNGAIFGWILISAIFFGWRYKYREENCVYYE